MAHAWRAGGGHACTPKATGGVGAAAVQGDAGGGGAGGGEAGAAGAAGGLGAAADVGAAGPPSVEIKNRAGRAHGNIS